MIHDVDPAGVKESLSPGDVSPAEGIVYGLNDIPELEQWASTLKISCLDEHFNLLLTWLPDQELPKVYQKKNSSN